MAHKKKATPEAAFLNCRVFNNEILPVLARVGSLRKKRLFTAACVRRIEDVIPLEFLQSLTVGIEVGERYADGKLTKAKLRQERKQFSFTTSAAEAGTEPEVFAEQAVSLLLHDDPDQPLFAVELSAVAICGLAEDQKLTPSIPSLRVTEQAVQVALMHDIFGNPFRPVAFDPAWRSDTAVSLAKHLYESRDFSAMPILADALQDAGCEHDDILTHCRDESLTHVRGCWVVDHVLGKT